MDFLQSAGDFFLQLIHVVYNLLWGDLITIPLPGGSSLGLSLLVLILIPMGIYCTIKTRFLPFRLFPEMIRTVTEKKKVIHEHHISGVQALVVSTATRVGMGNLVGVVAAISAGGAGAVFWMWGNRTFRLLHRFCRSYACSALQRKYSCTEVTEAAPLTISITFL